VRHASNDSLEQGRAAERRIIEDDAIAGDAADFGKRSAPVRRVHQHAQAHRCVERTIRKREAVRVAAQKHHVELRSGSSALRDREHFSRCVDPGHSGASRGERKRGASRAGSHVQDGLPFDRREKRGHDLFLCLGDEAANRRHDDARRIGCGR